ncbi:unnamed protein product [Cyclocybe aegerita]|uniref:BTB domain-containing protein n=1 Tax=Cyclocybe aegerita TaxID=1973307 RepID=A0A8S0W300_CYCAE|nr:unnamed protein product [Cyclocybe aegerita]
MTPSNDRDSGLGFINRHDKYYIEGADMHVVAQKTLFRVHGYFFARESTVFNRRLNPASPGDVKEGQTDNDPIILEDVSPEEFAKLLWVFYNPRYSIYDASIDDWTSILNLADKWGFREVKELAVRELHKSPSLSLIHKMALYQKYKVDPRHLVPLYAQLCERPTPLTREESEILGLEATLLVMTTREAVRAKPADASGGVSPLPQGMEMDDIFRAIEGRLELEEGSTRKFREENPGSGSPTTSSPTSPKVNGSSNRYAGQGAGRGTGKMTGKHGNK